MTHTPDWPLLWIKRDGETRTIMQDRFEIARMNPRGDFPDDIEEWQAMRAVTAVNSFEAMREALKVAERTLAAADISGMSCGAELQQVREAIEKAEAE